MSAQCQNCGGRATVFLCPTCTSTLRDLLEHLPQWIAHLEEAAVGQVRLGDSGGGRSTARREPFKGDDEVLAKCACGHRETKHDKYYVARDGNTRSIEQGCTAIDREVITTTTLQVDEDGQEVEVKTAEEITKPCQCAEYRPAPNQAKMRAQLLAAGRINARAADLLDAVRNSLTSWTRHIGEARGIVFVRPEFIGPLLAGHVRLANTTPVAEANLAENVHAIACDEAAGECLQDLQDFVAKIEKVINRPVPPRFCGPCTHYIEHNRHCGKLLYARRNAIETTCPACRTTHNIEKLTQNLELRMDVLRFTASEILMVMETLETPITERSWRRWRKEGRVKIRGYKRPDNEDGSRGAIRLSRHSEDDEPVYRLSDVKKVWATAIRHSDALTCEMTPV